MVVAVAVILVLSTAGQAMASLCGGFPWSQIPGESLPESVRQARDAIEHGMTMEAKRLLRKFILTSTDHPAREGARFALSTVLHHGPETAEEYRENIEYLVSIRQQYPQSVFGPWALCRIGNWYRQGGWVYEAQGVFEQFLHSYEGHPLTPAILISAGRNFLAQEHNLEAALVFKRVLDEPLWNPWYLQAALGLADSSAAAKAWEKAQYWYEAVELEDARLIRQSPISLYLRGESEMFSGHAKEAMDQFILAVNLHPHHVVAGKAMNRLTDYLLEQKAVVPGLWFANEAATRFPQTVPGFYGRAALLRWAITELARGPDAVFDSPIRPRLAELGFAVPESWEAFRTAVSQFIEEVTSQVPELAEEAAFWFVKSYHAQGRVDEAMEGLANMLRRYGEGPWGQKSGQMLRRMVEQIIQEHRWTQLGRFLDRDGDVIPLLGSDPELRFMLAESYRLMELPVQALNWYDQVLKYRGHPDLHEQAMRWKVVMALNAGDIETAAQTGLEYAKVYPKGRWLGELAVQVGQAANLKGRYDIAVPQFLLASRHAPTKAGRLKARRQWLGALYGAGRLEQAIAGYQQLKAEGAADSQDLLRLADLLFEHEEYGEAGREYQAAVSRIEEDDLRLWARYRLALSYQRMGQEAEAQALLAELSTIPEPPGTMAGAIVATASATAAAHQDQLMKESKGINGSKN